MMFKGFKKQKKKDKPKPQPDGAPPNPQHNNNRLSHSRTRESDGIFIKEDEKVYVPAVKPHMHQNGSYQGQAPYQQENEYRNYPQPNQLTPNSRYPAYEPQRSRLRDKYKQVSEKLEHMETITMGDKDEVTNSLAKLDPINNIEESTIRGESESTKEKLGQLIKRIERIKELELKDKMDEREKLKKNIDASEDHLERLKDALDSTKKEFEYQEYEKSMKDYFDQLKSAFRDQLNNNPQLKKQLEKDYDLVLLFIVNQFNKCGRCKSVEESVAIIQKKIKNDDNAWLENLNSKVSISLLRVKHDDYNLEIKCPRNDIVNELHRLYSGYKSKINIEFDKNLKCQLFDIGGYDALLNLTATTAPTALVTQKTPQAKTSFSITSMLKRKQSTRK